MRGGEQLLLAAKAMVEKLNRFGAWDNGCYYYQGKSASELQSELSDLQGAVRNAEYHNDHLSKVTHSKVPRHG